MVCGKVRLQHFNTYLFLLPSRMWGSCSVRAFVSGMFSRRNLPQKGMNDFGVWASSEFPFLRQKFEDVCWHILHLLDYLHRWRAQGAMCFMLKILGRKIRLGSFQPQNQRQWCQIAGSAPSHRRWSSIAASEICACWCLARVEYGGVLLAWVWCQSIWVHRPLQMNLLWLLYAEPFSKMTTYCFKVTFHSEGWKSRPLAPRGRPQGFLFPASEPELDKVFLMPEGYRHDIQHGNQYGPQRLPDISMASLHVFECDVNEKTPVQCMNTLKWSRQREQAYPEHSWTTKTISLRLESDIMTVMISHDSILPVPEEIPHKFSASDISNLFWFCWPFGRAQAGQHQQEFPGWSLWVEATEKSLNRRVSSW